MENENKNTYEEKPITLGKSNLQISVPLGIGTWAWGDQSLWEYKPEDEENIYQGFAKTMDKGINFYDTAEIYGKGKSESLLGSFIKRYQKEHENSSAVVASKFIPLPWKFTRGSFFHSLNGSLQRLNLPHIDLYQVHGPAFSLRSVETWAETMAVAYENGLIKSVGVSNFNADQVRRFHKVLSDKGIPLATNQIEFSLLRNNALVTGLAETCKELGVTIIAYSPLAMGRLTGKYSKENPPPSNRKFGSSYTIEEIDEVVNVLKELGKKYDKTPAQVALNWIICKGAVPIVGIKSVKQAEENLGCIGWRLSPEEVEQLDNVSKTAPTTFWQES